MQKKKKKKKKKKKRCTCNLKLTRRIKKTLYIVKHYNVLKFEKTFKDSILNKRRGDQVRHMPVCF